MIGSLEEKAWKRYQF